MTATRSNVYADRRQAAGRGARAAGTAGSGSGPGSGSDDQGRNRHRRPPRRGRRGTFAAAVGMVVLVVAGVGYVAVTRHDRAGDTRAEDAAGHSNGRGRAAAAPPADHPAAPSPTVSPAGSLASITGLGPKTLAAVPAASTQVLVASGKAADSPDSTVTLWTKTSNGRWLPGAAWPAHNALHGWTRTHHAGDLHSPIGVFTLHDAGGFEPDPGTKLPYHHSSEFQAGGVGFDGEPLDEAFDYVIAVDYNRVPGTSPLNGAQPMGSSRGGGIWVHVDHGGPTHGCVSVSAAHMVDLLHTLAPADHPVIVMGDRKSLAR